MVVCRGRMRSAGHALHAGRAQTLAGSVTAAYAWQHESGNGDAFRTQWGLREGFSLEGLSLATADGTFLVEASGLGGAEPARDARLVLRPLRGLRFEATYARRESFFGLADPNDWGGRDQWSRTRYGAKLAWDAGSAVRVTAASCASRATAGPSSPSTASTRCTCGASRWTTR